MTTKKFNPKARANEIAEQLKAAEKAAAAYDAAIDDAVKNAGRTRAEFVEVLYDHFGIEPETTERKDKNGNVVKNKDGEPVLVKTDKDESVRIEKLAKKFEELVERAESAKSSGSQVPSAVKAGGHDGDQFGQKAS